MAILQKNDGALSLQKRIADLQGQIASAGAAGYNVGSGSPNAGQEIPGTVNSRTGQIVPGIPPTMPSFIPQPQSQTNSLGGIVPQPQGDHLTNFNKLVFDMLNQAKSGAFAQKSGFEELQSANAMAPASQLGIEGLAPGDMIGARQNLAGQYKPAISNINDRVQLMNDSLKYAMSLGETYFKNLPANEEDAEPFRLALRSGQELSEEALQKYGKFFKLDDYAAGLAASKSKKATSDGLTPGQINTTVNSIAGAFDNEPIVKAYNTTQEGYQTIKSIGVDTKSPADDIAFIYAFAKIMDPNSVVREGEYNTIQKYAQTWAANFGFTAQRIFSNTNFLSADAKQKMLNALTPKITTIEGQYKNLNAEYQRQVNDAYAGKPRQITNYEVPTQGQTGGQNSNDPLGIR